MNFSVIFAIIFALSYYVLTVIMARKIKITTRDVCVAGMVIAMTIVLELIIIPLPTGATICLFSPVPLLLLALLWDYRLAMVSGGICGVLALILLPSWQPIHWAQFFVEHLICFSCLGYAGIFGRRSRLKMTLGVILASCIKVVAHVLSGVVFFSQNAWDGWGALGYSLAFNLTSMVPLCVLSGVIVLIMPLSRISRAIKRGDK